LAGNFRKKSKHRKVMKVKLGTWMSGINAGPKCDVWVFLEVCRKSFGGKKGDRKRGVETKTMAKVKKAAAFLSEPKASKNFEGLARVKKVRGVGIGDRG